MAEPAPPDEPVAPGPTKRPPWWRRRWVHVTGASLLALIIIAAVFGEDQAGQGTGGGTTATTSPPTAISPTMSPPASTTRAAPPSPSPPTTTRPPTAISPTTRIGTTNRPTTSAPVPVAMLPPPPIGVVIDDADSADVALKELGTLPVKGRAPMTDYGRDQFGPAWTDDVAVAGGRNGCDTRNDILRRDLDVEQLKANSNGCVVLTGTLHDPYTATTIPFERGAATSSAVQIDHVVSLGNAWATGAQYLSVIERTEIANDPINLQATDGPTNHQKGNADAATWLPPHKAFRCTYVARQVVVKSKYRLWVTSAERAAIATVLRTCGATAALPNPTAPNPITPTQTRPTATADTPRTTPATTTPAQPQGCHPLSNAGNCYKPGQVCRTADRGSTGVDAYGSPIRCIDNGTSWQWTRT